MGGMVAKSWMHSLYCSPFIDSETHNWVLLSFIDEWLKHSQLIWQFHLHQLQGYQRDYAPNKNLHSYIKLQLKLLLQIIPPGCLKVNHSYPPTLSIMNMCLGGYHLRTRIPLGTAATTNFWSLYGLCEIQQVMQPFESLIFCVAFLCLQRGITRTWHKSPVIDNKYLDRSVEGCSNDFLNLLNSMPIVIH